MCTLLRHSEAERAEFDMTLALLDDEEAAYVPPDWVDVRQLDGRKSLLRSVRAAGKLIRELQPDVTLSFLTRSNVASVINARGPCVISERANTSAHFGSGVGGALSRGVVRAVYPRATRVIAVSAGVADDLRDNFGVPGEKLSSIPNPVDVETISARAQEPAPFEVGGPYIMAAGRLVASKNFDMLIRAYALWGGDAKLLIVGEGPERPALEALIQELGLFGRVLLPGFVDKPYPLMRGADVFVLSSNGEGFPNALVEAMALGVPVIAANCASGPSEILAETARENITELTYAQHGVIAPPNEPQLVAQALRGMEDPERRRSYASKAAARARAFGPEIAAERYWAVLREALAEAR